MKEAVKKFLEFNGKIIYFIAADGQYWIAIKPICEALDVDYIRQFKNLKSDDFLVSVLSKQTMQGPDNQMRNYVCLPESFIYGWIFQIQSSSPDLMKYKWECYRVLYEYFHGTIGGRKDLLKEKAKAQNDIDKVMNSISSDLAFQMMNASKRINIINAQLRKLDSEAIQEEKTLFDTL